MFGEHGEEIQNGIRTNWHWFREYLARLRKSRALVAAADEDEDEERGSGSLRGVHAGSTGGSSQGSTTKSVHESAALHLEGEVKVKHKMKSAPKTATVDELNSLEMPMRKVHGKMERKLRLLLQSRPALLLSRSLRQHAASPPARDMAHFCPCSSNANCPLFLPGQPA